ncbi:MAG: YidB family protein [Gammaproteobacteria bacterium]
MSRGMPSMVALLGLLAVAGYKNRDKIAEALAGRKQAPLGGPDQPDQQGSVLAKLGGLLGGGSAGSIVSGGLRDLIERFRQNGQGHAADSWVSTGPNQQLRSEQIEQAIGPEVLDTLSHRTGLSREDLLSRLTQDLPAAVDKFTPAGRLPTEDEAAGLI